MKTQFEERLMEEFKNKNIVETEFSVRGNTIGVEKYRGESGCGKNGLGEIQCKMTETNTGMVHREITIGFGKRFVSYDVLTLPSGYIFVLDNSQINTCFCNFIVIDPTGSEFNDENGTITSPTDSEASRLMYDCLRKCDVID